MEEIVELKLKLSKNTEQYNKKYCINEFNYDNNDKSENLFLIEEIKDYKNKIEKLNIQLKNTKEQLGESSDDKEKISKQM